MDWEKDLLRPERSLVASSSCSSLFTAGEMFVDDRILTLFKRNAHHTLTYWSVFFSFGLCIAFLGPTILDLQCQTNSTLSQITWVFFSQQFCLLIGSSVGGVFKRTWVFHQASEGFSSILYRQLRKPTIWMHHKQVSPSTFRLFSALSALFVSALIISVIFAIVPLCNNVLVLAIAMAVSGLAMGVIDTIANIQLVTIYQKDSAVFLQVKNTLKPNCFWVFYTANQEVVHLVLTFFAGSSLLHWVGSLGEPADCWSLPLRDRLWESHRQQHWVGSSFQEHAQKQPRRTPQHNREPPARRGRGRWLRCALRFLDHGTYQREASLLS